MAKKPLILENGTSFDLQGDAVEYFKRILNSSKQRFTPNDKEFSDLLSLYKRHPEFVLKSKSADNIDYFLIKNSGEWDTLCYHTVHKDGSQTDWKYRAAITGKGQSRFQSFVDGARHALELEENFFRDAKFTANCKVFLHERGISEDSITADMVSEPANAQYRSSLLEPVRSEFLNWYKSRKHNHNINK